MGKTKFSFLIILTSLLLGLEIFILFFKNEVSESVAISVGFELILSLIMLLFIYQIVKTIMHKKIDKSYEKLFLIIDLAIMVFIVISIFVLMLLLFIHIAFCIDYYIVNFKIKLNNYLNAAVFEILIQLLFGCVLAYCVVDIIAKIKILSENNEYFNQIKKEKKQQKLKTKLSQLEKDVD